MAARGETLIGEGRSDECVGARRRLFPSPISNDKYLKSYYSFSQVR